MKKFLILGIFGVCVTLSSFADEVSSASVRKDINSLVFGNSSDQKYSMSFKGEVGNFDLDDQSPCSVSIESDPDSKLTKIAITGSVHADFSIADTDAPVERDTKLSINDGNIYFAKGSPSEEVSLLRISRIIAEDGRPAFSVVIVRGFRFPVACIGL